MICRAGSHRLFLDESDPLQAVAVNHWGDSSANTQMLTPGPDQSSFHFPYYSARPGDLTSAPNRTSIERGSDVSRPHAGAYPPEPP